MKVVNIKDPGFKAGNDFIYVGRPTRWGNPFQIGKHGTRTEVIEKFRQYLKDNPKLTAAVKERLKGKTLGCYCAPLPCHGDVLLEIANQE